MGLKPRKSPASAKPSKTRPLQEVIRETVQNALDEHGSLRQAAKALEVAPSSLSDMARRYNIKIRRQS
jgi:transcriptional regulator with GAF, ATPase, and Fis domain